ncbi:MAG: dGTP triphosphohydrolase [Bryobacteraceae bacterium]
MNRPLARLRFPVERSRGRRYPELSHPWRNEFQRDRDRVIHTRAFRRLEAKTQVFTPGLSDHFRNRLTHTIEVAQIARTAASALGLNDDLTEALALVHDIGHPPFGHAGEAELNLLLAPFGGSFNHNLHALRTVEALEQRYARFPGLNLTFEVREGIVKHSRDLDAGQSPELDEYLPGLQPTLEAQLIDLADEVAYDTADLDDAFSAGLFSMDDAAAATPRFAQLLEQVQGQFPGSSERVQFQEILRGLIDGLVSGLVEGTIDRAEAAGVRDAEEIRAQSRRLASFTAEAEAAARDLKAFLRARVYYSEPLVTERQSSAAMIGELFDYFLDHPDRLPEGYTLAGDPAWRGVCDYIAGMTDGFFLRTYRDLLASGAR